MKTPLISPVPKVMVTTSRSQKEMKVKVLRCVGNTGDYRIKDLVFVAAIDLNICCQVESGRWASIWLDLSRRAH